MKTADHPNARWLSAMYGGSVDIKGDSSASTGEREQRMAEHVANVMSRFAPGFVIHTGGRRLAAVGGLDLMRAYSARRMALSGGTFRAVEMYEIVADDDYGCVSGRFHAERPGGVLDTIGMGVWRFADGFAAEHWEIVDSDAFDRFFIGADPAFGDGSADDFWRRAAAS